MLLPNLSTYPDDDRSVESRGICKQLPKVTVICRFQLILDHDLSISTGITGVDIAAESAHRGFSSERFQIKTQCFTKKIEILTEPRGEVTSFRAPQGARLEVFQFSEVWRHCFLPNPSTQSRYQAQATCRNCGCNSSWMFCRGGRGPLHQFLQTARGLRRSGQCKSKARLVTPRRPLFPRVETSLAQPRPRFPLAHFFPICALYSAS